MNPLAPLTVLAAAAAGPSWSTPVMVAVVAGLLGSVPGVLAYRASSRANQLSERKVDGEAFERAQSFWAKQLDAADHQMERLTDQLARAEEINRLQRDQIRTLQSQVRMLEDLVAGLQAATGRKPAVVRDLTNGGS